MMQLLFAIAACLLLTTLAAAQAPSKPATDEATGSESLGPELLEGLTPLAPSNSTGNTPSQQRQPTGGTMPAHMQPPADNLGEDIGQPSAPLPLVRAQQGMQQAEKLLTPPLILTNAHSLQAADAMQQQVVKHLDELIGELSKQCQACRQGGQKSQSNQTQASQQQGGQSADPNAAQGNTAARDSTTRLGESAADPIEKADIDDLMNRLWGHLPERSREQMLQSFSHEFLPKYELEIEEYYRRLSEEQGSIPRRDNEPSLP